MHLRRMDPLASDASPYRREGQMGPEESLDVDDFQQRDFLSDLEALSDADDTDKDHLLTKAFANLPRQSSKSGALLLFLSELSLFGYSAARTAMHCE